MNNVQVFVLNEGGFAPLDKDNFCSYKELGVEELLPNFLRKRLESFGYKNYRFIQNLSEINAVNCEFMAVINFANPFIDPALLSKMIFSLKKCTDYDMCKSEGAIPGTEPDFVARADAWARKRYERLNCLKIRHDTQSNYNCQVNLRKFKRIKIFKNLAQSIDGLERLTIDELMSLFSSEEVFRKIISYFEDVSSVYLSECPYCGGDIEPLKATVSQPMIGFIPDSKPYHYQCVNCKLIVVSPTVSAEETHKLYDIYTQEGQQQAYFLKQKCRYQHYELATKMIKALLPQRTRGLDLGSGSGTFIYYTHEHYPLWQIIASDFPQTLEYFKYPEGIETKLLNFLREPIGNNEYDLITAWEVVEHVPFSAFEEVLKKIHAALKSAGIFVFSTPDFDSPLSRAWDFYNLCPPHHLLVFSKSWMYKFFSQHPDFELVGIANESNMFIEYESWFKYWATTSKNFESRALAKLFLEMLRDEQMNKTFRQFLLQKNWGMEMIVAVRKK